MMFRLSPTVRISLGMMLLTVSILLLGDLFGLLPNQRESILDARKKISESLAVQFSSALGRNQTAVAVDSLHALVERNSDILSAGIRVFDGSLLATAGDHPPLWNQVAGGKSTPTHVQVPIFKENQYWGSVEIRFDPMVRQDLWGVLPNPIAGFFLFVAVAGFAGYFLLLRKSLRHLDPTAVIPERVKSAFDVLAEGVIILDENERIVLANRSFCKNTEQSAEVLFGQEVSKLNWRQKNTLESSADLPWSEAMHSREAQTGVPLSLTTSNGERTFTVNAAPILDENHKNRGVLATFDDVTLLEKRNEVLRNTLRMLKGSQKKITEKNKELQELAARDSLTGCYNRRAFFEEFESAFVQAQEQGTDLACIMTDIDRFKTVNDRYGHSVGDKVIKVIANILQENCRGSDVVGRYGGEEFCVSLPGMNLEQALKTAERIRSSIEQSREMRFTSLKAITSSFGVSCLSFNAKDPLELVNQADKALYAAKHGGRNRVESFGDLKKTQDDEKAFPQDTGSTGQPPSRQTAGSGSEAQTPPQREESADVRGLRQRIMELEETIERNAEEFEHQLVHDKLTGLPNRILFLDRVQQAIRRGARLDHAVALLSLNVDTMSHVNTTLGPLVADQLLKKISERLVFTVRGMDTVAALSTSNESSTISRLGGEEFGILLTDLKNAESVTWIVRRIIEALSERFELANKDYYFTCTIGISLYPLDGNTPNILIRNATSARHHARQRLGHNNYQFYLGNLNKTAASHMEIESQLHDALAGEQFLLHYQPKVDVHTHKINGMEALVRWQHPVRGMISPFDFIPVAERTGVIVPIGEWVLRTACLQCKEWLDQGIPFGQVAVNLSALQLRQRDIVDLILEILSDTGLDSSHLEIELTESAIIEDFENSASKLKMLRDRGIRIALDDFGTGYSSLSYLKNLPVDTLKIDRTFVRNIDSDSEDVAIVTAVATLAHSLGLKVVAEGVETIEQEGLIRQTGCDEIQGYLFSKPLPMQEATEMLRTDQTEDTRLAM